MRQCPAQFAIQTALGGYQSINELLLPGGRLLEQRNAAHRLLTSIPGVDCVMPKGAIYLFPRLDPAHFQVVDDVSWYSTFLNRKRFSWCRAVRLASRIRII